MYRGAVRVTLFFLLTACAVAGAEPVYVWPLELPRVLTSSFGEYRMRGFHMGIDLRTGGIGRPVHAAADGYIARLRVSPTGYGKAVYLRLADGYTVIYAHLDDFSPALREYVRQFQHTREEYSVDLYPNPEDFPVIAGEVIAKSGQTGIGAPHLHFEIRDPAGRPVNPHTLGLNWTDSVRPVFRKVLIFPVTPSTRINGDVLPVVLDARKVAAGRYECEPVSFDGTVAFGIDVVDRANAPSTRLGVHTVRTRSAGRDLFVLEQDRVSYSNNSDGVVAYHPYFLDRGRFLLQWRWPGNNVEMYRNSPADGELNSSDRPTQVTIETIDFMGNAATLTIPISANDAEEPAPPPTQDATSGIAIYEIFAQWPTVTVRFDGVERERPRLQLTGGIPGDRFPFRRVDASTFRVNVILPIDAREITLDVHHPRVAPAPTSFVSMLRGDRTRQTVFGDFQVTIPPQSPYGRLLFRVDPTTVSPWEHLRPRGPAYTLSPVMAPIDEPIQLVLPIPDTGDRSRLAVYRKNGEKHPWEYLAGEEVEGLLHVSSTALGTFTIMEDVAAPAIERPRPRAGTTTKSRRPEIRATVRDLGSGIDRYTVTANGAWLLMEYDPERETLEWARDEDLPLGPVQLNFNVTDRAGNTKTREIDITVGGK